MMALLALVTAYVGFALLALAMDRHYRQVRGGQPVPALRVRWRAGGSLGLVLSLAACVMHDGWSHGLVLWWGVLSTSGIAVVLMLSLAPRRVLPFISTRQPTPFPVNGQPARDED